MPVRIEEARARYGFTRADLFPQFDLAATAGKLRFNGGSLVHTPEGENTASAPTETAIYALSAQVNWEIDFFGRIRRATEAQKALFLGTQEARRSAVLTLVADVAQAYLELRSFDLQLDIAQRTIQSRRESSGMLHTSPTSRSIAWSVLESISHSVSGAPIPLYGVSGRL